MGDNRTLIVKSIVKFLRKELAVGGHDDDCLESLDVAVQCIESAFGLNERNAETEAGTTEADSEITPNLDDIFRNLRHHTSAGHSIPENHKLADEHKNRGNALMQLEKYQEALDEYSKAIELYNKNAVYYCNRAAAHSKLDNHQAAIDDANHAIQLDPNYGKAYGRLGIAYSNLKRYEEAKNAYKKALELEPDNRSYRYNLVIAEEGLRQSQCPNSTPNTATQSPLLGSVPLGGTGAGDFADVTSALSGLENINQIFANPNVVNLARQILGNADMRDMMQGVLQTNIFDGANGLGAVMNVGQQLMQELQTTNPDLIDQVRRTIHGDGDPSAGGTPTSGTTTESAPSDDGPPSAAKPEDPNKS